MRHSTLLGGEEFGEAWEDWRARFAGMVQQEAGRHPKERYRDFVSDKWLVLDTGFFYDGYHFNDAGADFYSAYLADMLVREVVQGASVKPE